jgi:hypothetical protein
VKTEAQSKYRIQFIGKQGAILSEAVASPATYTFKGDESYVRAKVIESNGKLAWAAAGSGRRECAEMTPIAVVAAVIERDGDFLLTLRPDGTHLSGHWEFPGGKVHRAKPMSRRSAGKSSKSLTPWRASATCAHRGCTRTPKRPSNCSSTAVISPASRSR